MVCDAVYYNPVPYNNMKHWYELSNDKALIPLQQVLHTGIVMESLSYENKPINRGKIYTFEYFLNQIFRHSLVFSNMYWHLRITYIMRQKYMRHSSQ